MKRLVGSDSCDALSCVFALKFCKLALTSRIVARGQESSQEDSVWKALPKAVSIACFRWLFQPLNKSLLTIFFHDSRFSCIMIYEIIQWKTEWPTFSGLLRQSRKQLINIWNDMSTSSGVFEFWRQCWNCEELVMAITDNRSSCGMLSIYGKDASVFSNSQKNWFTFETFSPEVTGGTSFAWTLYLEETFTTLTISFIQGTCCPYQTTDSDGWVNYNSFNAAHNGNSTKCCDGCSSVNIASTAFTTELNSTECRDWCGFVTIVAVIRQEENQSKTRWLQSSLVYMIERI